MITVNKSKSEELAIQIMRSKRNQLLSDTDIYMVADFPISEEARGEWKNYRQELRDFPATCDINKLVWPVMPIKKN